MLENRFILLNKSISHVLQEVEISPMTKQNVYQSNKYMNLVIITIFFFYL